MTHSGTDTSARAPENGRGFSLTLTAALHGMNHAVFNMFTPLTLVIMRHFGFVETAEVTLGFSLYLICYGFGQIPMGILSDRLSRKHLLGAGAVLNGVVLCSVAAFPDYRFFVAGLAVSGFGAAAYHPVGASYLSDLYSDARGRALGLSGVGATCGLFLGPVVGGLLCGVAGWRGTFLIFGVVCAALGLLFIRLAVEPRRTDLDCGAPKSAAQSLPAFIAIVSLIFLFREFAGWGSIYVVPIFAQKIHGHTAAFAGLLTGFTAFGGFVAQPLGGILSDRFGRRGLAAALLGLTAVAAMAVPHTGRALLAPSIIFFGLFYSATVPILDALIADRAPAKSRGSVFGIIMAAGIGMSGFSPIVQSRIIDAGGGDFRSFSLCFLLLGVSALASMCVMLAFRRAGK